jgi:hypothetical protein
VRREALLAHATQVDPNSRFWFGLPPEVMRSIHPVDDYRLAAVAGPGGIEFVPSAPEGVTSEGGVETDLFAGLRDGAGVPG